MLVFFSFFHLSLITFGFGKRPHFFRVFFCAPFPYLNNSLKKLLLMPVFLWRWTSKWYPKIPFTFFLSLNFLWINSILIFFIFQIFVQILANSIDITDVTMACVDGVTKLRISIPEDFKSFFKDGGSLVLRIQDPESWKFEDRIFLRIWGS